MPDSLLDPVLIAPPTAMPSSSDDTSVSSLAVRDSLNILTNENGTPSTTNGVNNSPAPYDLHVSVPVTTFSPHVSLASPSAFLASPLPPASTTGTPQAPTPQAPLIPPSPLSTPNVLVSSPSTGMLPQRPFKPSSRAQQGMIQSTNGFNGDGSTPQATSGHQAMMLNGERTGSIGVGVGVNAAMHRGSVGRIHSPLPHRGVGSPLRIHSPIPHRNNPAISPLLNSRSLSPAIHALQNPHQSSFTLPSAPATPAQNFEPQLPSFTAPDTPTNGAANTNGTPLVAPSTPTANGVPITNSAVANLTPLQLHGMPMTPLAPPSSTNSPMPMPMSMNGNGQVSMQQQMQQQLHANQMNMYAQQQQQQQQLHHQHSLGTPLGLGSNMNTPLGLNTPMGLTPYGMNTPLGMGMNTPLGLNTQLNSGANTPIVNSPTNFNSSLWQRMPLNVAQQASGYQPQMQQQQQQDPNMMFPQIQAQPQVPGSPSANQPQQMPNYMYNNGAPMPLPPQANGMNQPSRPTPQPLQLHQQFILQQQQSGLTPLGVSPATFMNPTFTPPAYYNDLNSPNRVNSPMPYGQSPGQPYSPLMTGIPRHLQNGASEQKSNVNSPQTDYNTLIQQQRDIHATTEQLQHLQQQHRQLTQQINQQTMYLAEHQQQNGSLPFMPGQVMAQTAVPNLNIIPQLPPPLDQASIVAMQQQMNAVGSGRGAGGNVFGAADLANAKKANARDFVCTVCSEVLHSRFSLKRHLKKHTGDKPHVCTFERCTKSFFEASTLKRHMRIHTGVKPYRCRFENCGKAFADATNVKRHEMTHTGSKPFVCILPECARSFSRSSSLKMHMSSVHKIDASTINIHSAPSASIQLENAVIAEKLGQGAPKLLPKRKPANSRKRTVDSEDDSEVDDGDDAEDGETDEDGDDGDYSDEDMAAAAAASMITSQLKTQPAASKPNTRKRRATAANTTDSEESDEKNFAQEDGNKKSKSETQA